MNRRNLEDRVTEERRLCLGLESLREAYSQDQASPATEERLLAELRLVSTSAQRPTRQSWRYWGLAAAAVLLVACGLTLWLTSSKSIEPQQTRQIVSKPALEEPVRAGSVTAEARSDRIGSVPAQAVPERKPRLKQHTATRVAARSERHAPGSETASRPEPDAFIPTMFPTDTDADYGLQLVRVQLPRRTMMSFGLRVDSRQLNTPVKADLIIGPDGLTRAIRFVP